MAISEVEVVTLWSTLIHLARDAAAARASGDPEWIERAECKHKEYEQLCLRADRMIIPQVD